MITEKFTYDSRVQFLKQNKAVSSKRCLPSKLYLILRENSLKLTVNTQTKPETEKLSSHIFSKQKKTKTIPPIPKSRMWHTKTKIKNNIHTDIHLSFHNCPMRNNAGYNLNSLTTPLFRTNTLYLLWWNKWFHNSLFKVIINVQG